MVCLYRAILASSGQVVWNQRLTGPWPIGPDVQVSPRYWYAATKVFLEAAGKAFAEAKYIPSVFAIRLGWCPRTPEQVESVLAKAVVAIVNPYAARGAA